MHEALLIVAALTTSMLTATVGMGGGLIAAGITTEINLEYTTLLIAAYILLFGWLGFSFISYWGITLGMSIGVIAGAFIDTHIRYKLPEDLFRNIMRWILTLLAVHMIIITWSNARSTGRKEPEGYPVG